MPNDRIRSNISRRAMLKVGGTTLVAIWSRPAGNAEAGQQPPGVASPAKPILLAPGDATDVSIHFRRENEWPHRLHRLAQAGWVSPEMRRLAVAGPLRHYPPAGSKSQPASFRRLSALRDERCWSG